jgi:hypothetical protein
VSRAGWFLILLVTMPVDTAVGVLLMIAPHELFPALVGRVGQACWLTGTPGVRSRGPAVISS